MAGRRRAAGSAGTGDRTPNLADAHTNFQTPPFRTLSIGAMDSAAAVDSNGDFVILPRSSSKGVLSQSVSFSSKSEVSLEEEPPLPPKRTDSLTRVGSNEDLRSIPHSPVESAAPKSPVPSRKSSKNLLSRVSSNSSSQLGIPDLKDQLESAPDWSSLASTENGKDIASSPLSPEPSHSPIVASVPPVQARAPAPPSPIVIESSPTTPPFMLEDVPEPLVPNSPSYASGQGGASDAELTARLMDLLPASPQAAPPTPVEIAPAPAPTPAAPSQLKAPNAGLAPINAVPAAAVVMFQGNRMPTSPSSPMMFMGGDDALVLSHMIGLEDAAAGERIRMQAQLVQAQPVVDSYAGRDLETVDEEEEAEELVAAPIPRPRKQKVVNPDYDDEDPRYAAPGASDDQSPYDNRHSQSMEALDQERDYSGPIISGLPRSMSTPRLDARGRLSTYQPNVSSPLAGAAKGPKKRRKSFRGNKPTAYGSARHSMVGLTPENMEELKKDAHAAIREMLLRGAEDDSKKRNSKLRNSTVPGSDDMNYAAYSRPDSYYPDEASSQISDGDRSSSFAPSMRTSRTAPDPSSNSRSPPKAVAFRARNDDHRASMMALDNLMHNEGQLGDVEDGFELPGSLSSSDLNGDLYDLGEDDTEDGSSGKGSSLPGNDGLFDSDMLSLDQADKALKYARRTQDVDERVSLKDL